jgi:hypothetical protein
MLAKGSLFGSRRYSHADKLREDTVFAIEFDEVGVQVVFYKGVFSTERSQKPEASTI